MRRRVPDRVPQGQDERSRASRRRYGLIGDPLEHSLSPVLYRTAFRHLGVGAEYELRHVPRNSPGAVEPAMRALAWHGGGNVTLPHKETAARALDVPSGAVRRSGACNCFWEDDDGQLAGDNTDVGGFLCAAHELPEVELGGGRLLLLGAGGAARAVLVASHQAGVRQVDVRSRNADRRERVRDELSGASPPLRLLAWSEMPEGPYDLVVNATPLGLSAADELPLDLSDVRPGAALDLVYAPGGTRWMRHAKALGVPCTDGRRLLVHQALLTLRRWFPHQDVKPGLETALHEAVERALVARFG